MCRHEAGIWIIDDLLTAVEARSCVEQVEEAGFRPAHLYDDGRHNEEAYLSSALLRRSLEDKLRNYRFRSPGGVRIVAAIGEPVESYKYRPGDYIVSHSDAACPVGGGLSSHTLVIYLNEDYSGGDTVFPEHSFRVQPHAGRGVLFQQELPHEASLVMSGVKYVVRACIGTLDAPP